MRRKSLIIFQQELADSSLWLDEKFSRGQAYLDMFHIANARDSKGVAGFKSKIFKRGCIYRSNTNLAERWRWSNDKVKNFLNFLSTTERIRIEGSGYNREIVLLEFEKYCPEVDCSDDCSEEGTEEKSDETDSTVDSNEDLTWFDSL